MRFYLVIILTISLNFSYSQGLVEHSVESSNFVFIPNDLSIVSGEVVAFSNMNGFHFVEWLNTPHNINMNNSNIIGCNMQLTNTPIKYYLEMPGVYNYRCGVHTNELGTITVTGNTNFINPNLKFISNENIILPGQNLTIGGYNFLPNSNVLLNISGNNIDKNINLTTTNTSFIYTIITDNTYSSGNYQINAIDVAIQKSVIQNLCFSINQPSSNPNIVNLQETINKTIYNLAKESKIHHYYLIKNIENIPISGKTIQYALSNSPSVIRNSLPSGTDGLLDLNIKVGGDNPNISTDDWMGVGTATVSFVGITPAEPIGTNVFGQNAFTINVVDKATPISIDKGFAFDVSAGVGASYGAKVKLAWLQFQGALHLALLLV